MSKPVRLDWLLVKRGLAQSRARAQELIETGVVSVDGRRVDKKSAQVDPDKELKVGAPDHPWVSRGALKLLPALDAFGVTAVGRTCADLGASTGGFTEVLLHRGARRVYAVDVGRGQLHWRLRQDARVVCLEGINVRYLETLPEPVSLVVADLSFISLRLVLPALRGLLPEGEAVVLVKPQFEVGPAEVHKGLVRSEELRARAIEEVAAMTRSAGFRVLGGVDSSVAGAKKGNREHFLHLRRP